MERTQVRAVGLRAVIGCFTMALACSPGPDVGGQTGDPGVSDEDHVSGVLQPDQQGGECAPLTTTDVAPLPALRWPAHGGSPVLVLETVEGDPSELVVADFAFGLRVVDASEPGALHAGEGLALDSPPLQLQRVDRARALLLTEREVLLVAIDGEIPTVLARVELSGRPRASHVIELDGEPWLHVLVDSYLRRVRGEEVSTICPPRERTSIMRYAVRGDELEPLSEIDLGAVVQAVRFDEDRALVVTGVGSQDQLLPPSRLQWLALSQDEPRPGAPLTLPGAVRAASDSSTRRWRRSCCTSASRAPSSCACTRRIPTR